jgi:hypothetical protein
MSDDSRLESIVAALRQVPPAPLESYPWQASPARPSRRLPRLRLAIVLSILAVGCAGVLLVSGIARNRPSSRLNRAIPTAFSVFERRRLDPSPEGLLVARTFARNGPTGLTTLAPSSFRLAQRTERLEAIVYGNAHVACVAAVVRGPQPSAIGACPPAKSATRSSRLACSWNAELFSCLVPNGVSHVTAAAGPSIRRLPVINNTVIAVLKDAPSKISWPTVRGVESVEM